jgi:hypothetical protein
VKRKKFSGLINVPSKSGSCRFSQLKRRVQTSETIAQDEETSFGHGFLILAAEISRAVQETGTKSEKWTFPVGSI